MAEGARNQLGLALAMKLPPPTRLGLKGFPTWRKGQDASVLRIVDSPKRFPCLTAPTGAGKTGIAAAVIRLLGGKWVYLTETKALQDQIQRELSYLGWVDLRGQGNYQCAIEDTTVDLGPCHAGVVCEHKTQGGCPYFDTVKLAKSPETSCTVTNYSWWFSHQLEGFPLLDGLICDEAHSSPDSIAEFLSAEFSRKDVSRYLGGYPPPEKNLADWAIKQSNDLETEIESFKYKVRADRSLRPALKTLKALHLRIGRLRTAQDAYWVVEETKYGWRVDPVWPAPYAESLLFRKTPKVVLVSATIRPKTLALLGLKPEDYDFFEAKSNFPKARRPFIHVPTVRLTYRSSDAEVKLALARVDQTIKRWFRYKGLIHPVSYARRNLIYDYSGYRDAMILHESGQQAEALAQFKASDPPRIFLSPSAHTGLDFPGDEARWQLLPKLPFPDQRSKILKARSKADKEYPFYLTALVIMQTYGRIVRSIEDWGVTICTDDNFKWFVKRYRRYFTAWFLEAIIWGNGIPSPEDYDPSLKNKRLTGSETVVRSET